ncbi:MAG: hypothetical protein GKR93_17280 [Gammaproteobacteria bacterium]|nr:hypothetical protein [Gammaproteobacteria bacterium]
MPSRGLEFTHNVTYPANNSYDWCSHSLVQALVRRIGGQKKVNKAGEKGGAKNGEMFALRTAYIGR